MLPLAPVAVGDFDEMAAIRIVALCESLECLAAGFVPEHMRHIVANCQRTGFITLRPAAAPVSRALQLDHLYIRPDFQSAGIGAWALDWAKAQDTDIMLSALKQSAANRFYLRHGFVQVGESVFDLNYRWYQSHGGDWGRISIQKK